MEALDCEAGRIGNGHHGHDSCLNGVADDEIGSIGNAAGHIKADDQKPFAAHLAHSIFDVATHQRTS